MNEQKERTVKNFAFQGFWAAAAGAALAVWAGVAAAAEPEGGGGTAGGWRVSAGYRAAPGIKTSAKADARAAVAAAGGALARPRGGGTAAGGTAAGTSVVPGTAATEDLGPTRSGTSEADAAAAAEYSNGTTRWEFDGGFIDMDDGSGHEGDTMNWQFTDAAAFADGTITAQKEFAETTTSQTRTSETETAVTRTAVPGTRSTSFSETYADDLSGSSTETGQGIEIRLDRTLWENGRWGVDFGLGFVWYDELDGYKIGGRAYSAKSAERTRPGSVTETSVTRTTTTETTTETTESGRVVTTVAAGDFEFDDVYNPEDGTIGSAYVEGGTLAYGRAPVLAVGPDTFSSETVRDPVRTTTTSQTTTTEGTPVTRTVSSGGAASSRSRTRTVDLRSEGTLSLQEVRFGVQPWWKVAEWLTLRAGLGAFAIHSELETRTEIFVDGQRARTVSRDKDDWTFGGYAGLGIGVALTANLELYAEAEGRFPQDRLHFDDGIVSGTIDLAEWSASAGVAWRF